MASPAGAQSPDLDCLSPEAQRLAEARLAAKRAARAEAREIRMKELERQQKEVEERPEKDFTEKGSRNMPGLSAATLASLGGTSSRRGSGDTSISIDTEASMREIKDSLAEVEEKYKKAMVSNAQLDNEKTNFMYQVDTLKDMLLELEEELAEARRQCEEKGKELEREKHAHGVLQFQFAEVKEALRHRDEMLEKHGIILNSEVATNGETSDTLNNVGHPGPTKMTKEELNALKSSGDGKPGRAKEVEVKNEIVENVGKREILQNTEQEQHKEDTIKDGVDVEVSHPGENAEGQKPSEDLANAEYEEQVQGQSPENRETPGQVGSQEVTDKPAEGTGASLGQPKCPEDLGSEGPGPVHRQDTCNASDMIDQSEKSMERQDQENQDLKTDLEEVHLKSCQGSAPVPVQGPQAEGVSSADPGGTGGSHTEKALEAGGAAARGPESHQGERLVDELDSSTGHSSEKELCHQEAAEPGEAPTPSTEVGRADSMEDEGDVEPSDEKPLQTEVQAVPGAPAAKSSHQEAPGPGRADTDREPGEQKGDHQVEASDSSQKKSKNKKKKNKKKKSPAPTESLEDVKKELTYQHADGQEVLEEQGQFADKKPVAEEQEEVTKNATQKIVAGSSGQVDGPEAELDGKLNQEDVKTEGGKEGGTGDTENLASNAVQSSGTHASDKELGEGVTNGGAETAGVAPEPEKPDETSSSLVQSESPSGALADASQTGSPERQAVQEDAGSSDLEKDDLSEPGGELGDLGSESGGHTTGGNEKGRGKEDCTMS